MPTVPMEMASLTVGMPKTTGIMPASCKAASARCASRPMAMLQGVTVAWALATPTMGFWKSRSPKPMGQSMARLGERSGPVVVSRLRLLYGIGIA